MILSKPLFLLNRLRGKLFNHIQGLRCKGMSSSVKPCKDDTLITKSQSPSRTPPIRHRIARNAFGVHSITRSEKRRSAGLSRAEGKNLAAESSPKRKGLSSEQVSAPFPLPSASCTGERIHGRWGSGCPKWRPSPSA